MITTENLGLTIWDQEKDDFEHSQLANNWTRIDSHNHEGTLEGAEWEGGSPSPTAELLKGSWRSAGKGLAITRGAIPPESIWRYLLALGAVGHRQIGEHQVYGSNVAPLGLETAHYGEESVTDSKIAKGTITPDKLESQFLPLGTVMEWWRPPGSGAEPGGVWHICDGTPWSSIKGNKMGSSEKELTTGSIPNLVGQFARGSSIANVGQTGGSANAKLGHTHVVNAHSHTVNSHAHSLPSHNHGINADGEHGHSFGGSGFNKGKFFPLFQRIIKYKQTPEESEAQALWLPQAESPGELEVPMSVQPAHSHGGVTSSVAGETSSSSPGTNNVSPGTSEALAEVNTEPPYVGLVYIMRVK